MLNVYVICNNALVHKQYVIAYNPVIRYPVLRRSLSLLSARTTVPVQCYIMTHADWLILGYTTVIIIFGIVCYIGLLKLITKGKHEK